MSVRAGFATGDITPPLGLPMGGYAARTGVAEGVLDGLQCRVAVFSSASVSVALVVLDLLYVSAAWADEARRRIAGAIGASPSQVLVAATHTHSGPAVFTRDTVPALAAYQIQLAEVVLKTVERARQAQVRVTLSTAEAEVEGVSASRRDAAEEIDRKVRVLVARRGDGACAGTIASFGCHPTVLPPANRAYSRDLFGVAADRATAELAAPVLLFNGAAADVSTRFTRREASIDEAKRLGAELGSAIARAAAAGRALDGEEIVARCQGVPIRLRRLPNEVDAEERLTQALAAVERERANGAASATVRLAVSRLEGAAAQLYLTRQGGWDSVLGRLPDTALLQDLNLCGVHILAAPGEVFSSTGRRLARRGRALLVGYANDYLGYLVPPERAADGEYEALMAALEPQSTAAVEQALEALASDG